MKNTHLNTPFQHVETLQQRKLYWKKRTISMLCVLLKVLLNRYSIKVQVTSFENKDIRGSMIFRINTKTRFFKALVFTVQGTVLGINIVPLSINAHAPNAKRLRLSHAYVSVHRTSCQQPAIVPRPTSVSYGGNGVNAAISVYTTR